MAGININDLAVAQVMDEQQKRQILGGRLAASFLFRSGARSASPAFIANVNIENFEVNNYNITYDIDKLVNQTNNQLQISMINVESGDGSAVNILSNQGLNGSNTSQV